MKKFFLLAFLMICNYAVAQVKYKVRITDLYYRITDGVKNKTSSNIYIKIHFQNGTNHTMYWRAIRENGDNEWYLDLEEYVSYSKPTQIECHAFVNFRGKDKDDTYDHKFKNVTDYCPNGQFNEWYGPKMTNISFKYEIIPVISISTPINNILPTHSKVNIKAATGFDTFNYKWQYCLNLSSRRPTWIDLPLFDKYSEINVSAIDILGDNVTDNIGKYIYFRIKNCFESANTIVGYSIRLSAPKVLSSSAQNTSCLYSIDGSQKLVFDRNLLVGEKLNYTIIDKNTNTPTDNNGVLTIDTDKTFEIKNLRAGTYILQLVGFKDGLSTAVDSDLHPLHTFTINPPPVLDFSLNQTNVNCFDGSDGSITITPTGGTRTPGGKDHYSLNNGIDWIAFPNNAPVTIRGLKTGTYNVMVKDMNECIAKHITVQGNSTIVGENKVIKVEITQPTDPIKITITENIMPTFHGGANGKITANVIGGTKGYTFIWDKIDEPKSSYHGQGNYNPVDGSYVITLNNAPMGEYKLTVLDSNHSSANDKLGCTNTAYTKLSQPDPIKISFQNIQNVSCNATNLPENDAKLNDGSITATVSGGVPKKTGAKYLYNWSMHNIATGQWEALTHINGPNATGLKPGKYALNVKDANGIVQGNYNTVALVEDKPTIGEVGQPTPLIITFTEVKNVSCHDGNDGEALATITGGTGQYTYVWGNVKGNAAVFQNRIYNASANDYILTVTDTKGCSSTQNVSITAPSTPLEVNVVSQTNPTFFGGSNGIIVVEVKGGTPSNSNGYNFVWKDSQEKPLASTKIFVGGIQTLTLQNVPKGTYYLDVYDQNYVVDDPNLFGCAVLQTTVELTQPDKLEVEIELEQAIKCSSKNNFGNPLDNSPKDGQRDESQDGIIIAKPKGGVPFDPNENNGNYYLYTWKKQINNRRWITLTNNNTDRAEQLSAGNYRVTITDKNGITTFAEYSLSEPAQILVNITHTNVSCTTDVGGSAVALANNGIGAYKYSWSNGTQGGEIKNVPAGLYTVTVTDGNSCKVQQTVHIREKIAIEYTQKISPTFYGGSNGTIVAKITGGTPYNDSSYKFEWKNSTGKVMIAVPSIINGVFTLSLNNIPADRYFLTIKDKNYNDQVLPINECTIYQNDTVLTQPDPLEISFEVVQEVSCNNKNNFGDDRDTNPSDGQRDESQDGILKATVSGGVPLDPSENNGSRYFYYWKKQLQDGSWLNLTSLNTETAFGLSAGTYSLNVKDKNGIMLGTYINNVLVAETDSLVSMQEPEQLKVSIIHENVSCKRDKLGTAIATASGGVPTFNEKGLPEYTYSWSNLSTVSSISDLEAGFYTVTARDSKGCSTRATVQIRQPIAVKYDDVIPPTHFGGSDGKIIAEVYGGTPLDDLSYQFEWKNKSGKPQAATGQVIAGRYFVTATGLSAGSYTLTIKDRNYNPEVLDPDDCTIFHSDQKLSEPDPLKVSFEVVQEISCNALNEFGDPKDETPQDSQRDESQDGILKATVSGGVPLEQDQNNGLLYYYFWKKQLQDGTWLDLPHILTETAQSLSHGNYALNIKDKNGISLGIYENNKLITAKDSITSIKQPTKLEVSISHQDVSCKGNKGGTAIATVSGGTAPYKYKWSNQSTAAGITDLEAGTYTLTVTDNNNCIVQSSVLIRNPISAYPIEILPPTYNGGSNGRLVVEIYGGTPFDDFTYKYEWKNQQGAVIETTAELINNIYTIAADNLPNGVYTLTIKDKNHNPLIQSQEDCTIHHYIEELKEPEPIIVEFKIVKPISCHSKNAAGKQEDESPKDGQRDESQDGKLQAIVKGGVMLPSSENKGLRYYYYWKKQETDGTWTALNNQTSHTATMLSHGKYAVNVKDRNGIMLGTFENHVFTPKDSIFSMEEPAQLAVSISHKDVPCFGNTGGSAIATVTGGIPPYNYKWSNNIETAENHNISAGYYYLIVTDSSACVANSSVLIRNPIAVNYSQTLSPSFHGATNGKLVAQITGGTPLDDSSYNYEWKNSAGAIQKTHAEVINGIYTISIADLPAETYTLTIKDKNFKTNHTANDCTIFSSDFVLSQPEPIKVVFEIVREISCNHKNVDGDSKDKSPEDGQRDESQDGILTAIVTGGVRLDALQNGGLSYFYTWKKQQDDGSWISLFNVKTETATELSHGVYALNVEDKNGIVVGTYVNNELVAKRDATINFEEPEPLSVIIEHGNVYCHDGNDGWATAIVSGGTQPYNYKWSNDVQEQENTVLRAGRYNLLITDKRGCTAKASVQITEPAQPLVMTYKEIVDPSFYKATNGKIVVDVSGGTIGTDNSYSFEWKNSKGVPQVATTSFHDGIYTISLQNIPEETYYLSVRDANYQAATYKSTCGILNSATVLDDPDPLVVNFELVRGISCSPNNTFGDETDLAPKDTIRDETQDAILKATVTGGIKLNPQQNDGLAYYYNWTKKQADGTWASINDLDETIEYLSEGIYALNVVDANGIILGTYVNNILTTKKDAIYNLQAPTQLNLAFTHLNSSCNNGADGWALANVSGGTPPYTYEWNTGDTTQKIENLTTNNYFVSIKDANNCTIQGTVFVGDPRGINASETIKNPSCFQDKDGTIILDVSGGNLPYSYLWSTGETTKDISNLPAGVYEVTIDCADCCVFKRKFTLTNPTDYQIDLGADRTLCIDQFVDLDATIIDPRATYTWTSTNGFTSQEPKVSLTNEGIYQVRATTNFGCIAEDTIEIKNYKVNIDSEFLLSSQAYLDEEIILINTSNPMGEKTFWKIPDGAKIVDQQERTITIKFEAEGTYEIGLQQTQGDCYKNFGKSILVEKRTTMPTNEDSQFIIDFFITPNPSDGNFNALVNLEKEGAINIRIFSSSGERTAIQKSALGAKKYELNFDTRLSAGMYVMVLETEQQTIVKKLIIH